MFTFLYLILKWVLLESCALWTIWSKHPNTQQRIRKEIHFFLSTVLFGLDWMHPWSSAAIIAVVKVLIQEAKWKGYWQKKLWWAHTKTHTRTSCLDEVSLMTTDWKRRKKMCLMSVSLCCVCKCVLNFCVYVLVHLRLHLLKPVWEWDQGIDLWLRT